MKSLAGFPSWVSQPAAEPLRSWRPREVNVQKDNHDTTQKKSIKIWCLSTLLEIHSSNLNESVLLQFASMKNSLNSSLFLIKSCSLPHLFTLQNHVQSFSISCFPQLIFSIHLLQALIASPFSRSVLYKDKLSWNPVRCCWVKRESTCNSTSSLLCFPLGISHDPKADFRRIADCSLISVCEDNYSHLHAKYYICPHEINWISFLSVCISKNLNSKLVFQNIFPVSGTLDLTKDTDRDWPGRDHCRTSFSVFFHQYLYHSCRYSYFIIFCTCYFYLGLVSVWEFHLRPHQKHF